MVYDSSTVRKDTCVEFDIPEQQVQKKDIFERDPLACRFVFLNGKGEVQNDLIVVGVHLASGQALVANHNTAMKVLRTRLAQAFSDGTFPAGEKDVVIGGDFNASRYDNDVEDFWDGFDSGGFRFLTLSSSDEQEYPGTRLAGVPLFPRSRIDYVLGSSAAGGLSEKLVQNIAHVHTELIGGGFDDFRAHVSDHIPVTIRIRVGPDQD